MIDRGARYKVYELIRTSVRLTGTRWLTYAPVTIFLDTLADGDTLERGARRGLRSAERARFDTSLTMEHRSPIGEARRKRRQLAQVSQRTRRHSNRICSDLRRRYLSRSCELLFACWLRSLSDLDGDGDDARACRRQDGDGKGANARL